MATQVVTQLIVDSQGAVTGVAAFEAAMRRAQGSFENLDTPIKTFNRSQADLGKVLASNNPVFAAQLNMQSDMERQNVTLSNSVKLGQITQSAANAELAKTTQRHEENIQKIKEHTGQLTLGERAMLSFKEATKGVSGNLIAMAEGLGPVGVAIAGMGGGFTAAAVIIGGVIELIKKVAEAATVMGEFARVLKESAETIGITTDQFQGLSLIAASVGVSTEKNTLAFERFTTQLNQLRNGTGTLFNELRKVAPELLTQLAATRGVTSAIDLMAKSYVQATDQIQKNAIARAAFGKAGFDEGRVLTAINSAGGLEAYTAGLNKADLLTEDQIHHWALLSVEIEHATSLANKNFAAIFTGPVLDAEKRFADAYLEFSREVKTFTLSGDWHKFIKDISSGEFLAYLAAIGAGAATGAFAGARLGRLTGSGLGTAAGAGVGAAIGGALGFAGIDTALNMTVEKFKSLVDALGLADKGVVGFSVETARWAAYAASKTAAVQAAVPLAPELAGFPMANVAAAILGLYAYTHSHEPMPSGEIMRQQRGGLPVRESIRASFQGSDTESTAQSEFKAAAIALKEAAEKLDQDIILKGALTGAIASSPVATPSTLHERFEGMPTGPAQLLSSFKANDMKTWTSAMGDALTIEEKFTLKTLDLNKAYDDNVLSLKGKESAEAIARRDRAQEAIDLDKVIALESARNNMLGAAAPVADIVKQKMDELEKKQRELAGSGQELSPGELANAKRLIQATADGTFALQAQIDATKVQTATIGMSIAAATTYDVVQKKINENLNAGKPALDGVSAGFLKLATTAGVAKQAQAELKAQNDATFSRQTVFLDSTEQQIAALQRSLHGNDWKAFMNDGLAASVRLTEALKTINQLGGDFASSFAKDIANGVKPMDALVNAAKALDQSLIDILAKKVATQAVGSLFGGAIDVAGPTTGATAAASIMTTAGSAVAASFVAGATAAAEILGAAIPAAATTLPAAGLSTGALVGTGGAVAGTALKEGGVEAAFSLSSAMGPLALLFAAVTAGLALFGLGGSAQKAADRAQILGYNNRAILANTDTTTLEGQLKQFDLNAAAEKAALPGGGTVKTGILGFLGIGPSKESDAAKALEAAQAQERLKIIRDFGTDAAAAEKTAEDQRLQVVNDFNRALNSARGNSFLNDFQDLMDNIAHFQAANVDPNQLIEFTQLAAQKLVDDGGLVGTAFTTLTAMFPQLVGVVHEATAAVQDQVAAQQQLNSAASGVVNYINGLLSGQGSTLSPAAILANAKSVFDSNLSLAQGGNLDAVNKFPQVADDLEKAARAVYASSQGYQDIRNQIIAQGLALPAVQQATDPVVLAVRDAIAAIQAGTATQATEATLLTRLTSTQLAGLGLATNATAGSIATNTGNLITAAQLAALGLSLDTTTGNVASVAGGLLTQTQLAALGLSLNSTTGQIANNVLTQGQLTALGLAANTTVAGLLTQAQLNAVGLASNTTVAGLLTAAQLAQAGLATNPTLVSTNTAIGTLLTQPQLQASGLAANTTVSGLLTAAQLAQAGLAANATVSGLLTQAQVAGLNLALNSTAAGLLTSTQLNSLGLSLDSTTGTVTSAVGGVTSAVSGTTAAVNGVGASAGQIATNTNNTATNTGTIGNINANTGFTATQTYNTAAGLGIINDNINGTNSGLATIAGSTSFVATQTYNTAAGLGVINGSIAGTNSGLGTVIANTGNAAISLSSGGIVGAGVSATAANTGSIVTNTGNTASNTGAIGSISINTGSIAGSTGDTSSGIGNIIINTGNTASLTGDNKGLLTSIQGLQTTAAAQLTLLSTALASSLNLPGGTIFPHPGGGATLFNIANKDVQWTDPVQVGQQVGQVLPTAITGTLTELLGKIVVNTNSTAFNTAEANRISGGNRAYRYGVFAEGGVIPPYGLGLVSEHSPGGGRFIRAGSEPITVSPNSPNWGGAANDNSALLAELRSLREEVAALRRENTAVTQAAARLSHQDADAMVEAYKSGTKQVAAATRMAPRNSRMSKAS